MASSPPPTNFRGILFAAVAGYFVQKFFKAQLLPHGAAKPIPPGSKLVYASVDNSNDSLQAKHGKLQKIFERIEEGKEPLMKGLETIVFGKDKDTTMYILTEEANLVSLTNFVESEDGLEMTAKTTLVKDLGMGRPLGGKFTEDGETLYVADAILGLIRIRNPQDPKSKVELITSQVLDNGRMSQIQFADDVTIGPRTGKVYFTDASDIAPDRVKASTWDVLYASKVDVMRGKQTGRLLQYDPSTDEVSVLARGIWFANGISCDQDETFLVVAETFGVRLLKYDLKDGGMKGLEVLVHSKDMVAYMDGVDCTVSESSNTKCYVALPSTISPIHKILSKLPDTIDVLVRTLLLSLPKSLSPPGPRYGGVLEVNPQTGESNYIQDPVGGDISGLNGVTVQEGKLYLGSLDNNVIGVYNLE